MQKQREISFEVLSVYFTHQRHFLSVHAVVLALDHQLVTLHVFVAFFPSHTSALSITHRQHSNVRAELLQGLVVEVVVLVHHHRFQLNTIADVSHADFVA